MYTPRATLQIMRVAGACMHILGKRGRLMVDISEEGFLIHRSSRDARKSKTAREMTPAEIDSRDETGDDTTDD